MTRPRPQQIGFSRMGVWSNCVIVTSNKGDSGQGWLEKFVLQ